MYQASGHLPTFVHGYAGEEITEAPRIVKVGHANRHWTVGELKFGDAKANLCCRRVVRFRNKSQLVNIVVG